MCSQQPLIIIYRTYVHSYIAPVIQCLVYACIYIHAGLEVEVRGESHSATDGWRIIRLLSMWDDEILDVDNGLFRTEQLTSIRSHYWLLGHCNGSVVCGLVWFGLVCVCVCVTRGGVGIKGVHV